ncbi:MAG TPA: matrixin family metalloprotease [Drouetiella sp.]
MRRSNFSVLKIFVLACTIFGATCGYVFAQDFNPATMSTNAKEEFVYNTLKECEQLIPAKKYVEARKKLKQAALLDPTDNSGNVHSSLGYVDQQLGDLEESIVENQKAMSYDQKFNDLTWNIAVAYKDLGDYNAARTWINNYLGTNPSDPKRVQEAQGLMKKLGEQANLNGAQSIRAPDYLDSLVSQHGVGRWPSTSFPLKIFIEKADDVPGVPPNSTQMLGNAFDAWNKAANGALPSVLVSNRKQADITIQWTNNPNKVSAHDGVHMEQGITRVRQVVMPGAPVGTIRSADILLLTVSRETGEPVPEDDMKGVCLHEVGHALGLGGHSANSADTMYFSVSARQLPALSHRDKTTIAKLYSYAPMQQTSFGMPNSNYGNRPGQYGGNGYQQAPFSNQQGQGYQSQFSPNNGYQSRPSNSGYQSQSGYQPPPFSGGSRTGFQPGAQSGYQPPPFSGGSPSGYPAPYSGNMQSGYQQSSYGNGPQSGYSAPQYNGSQTGYNGAQAQNGYASGQQTSAPGTAVPLWLRQPYSRNQPSQ